MIATITLNPSLDEFIMVRGLLLEETNRWVRVHRYAGGKGIDVARAIHEMGGETTAYGFIGGDNGRDVEILLDEEGVPFSFTPIKRNTRINFIINDTESHRQTIIGAPGPRISRRDLERFFNKLRHIRPVPEMVAVGGSVPPGVPDSIYYDIIREFQKLGVRTILDAEGQWLREGIEAKPYLIKPNVHEAEIMLGRELDSEEKIIDAAFELLESGPEIVVISRGKDGLIAAAGGKACKALPPPMKVRSSVGAGDCATAGLALKLARGESLVEACWLAAAMGAAAVLTPGTELSRRADVERLLPLVKSWEIPVNGRRKVSFPAEV